ncbi:MAG: DUF2723 domain-containing protein [Deltaproteobacteria bacterium]|nr:DUF2723 domain-containing protein [Deltaproteobacteria bacterium]
MTAKGDKTRALPTGIGILFFGIYAASTAPGVEWLDAGELTAAGWTLGISHPPGQPGHAILARAVGLIPLGEIAFRINLLSAALAAWAVALVPRLLWVLAGRRGAWRLAGIVPTLLFGLSPLVFEQATRAEVYAPAIALSARSLLHGLRFLRDERGHGRDVACAALLASLCGAFHPMIAVAAATPLALALAARLTRAKRYWPVAPAVGAAMLGLLVLAYLPIRDQAGLRPLLAWGEPGSAASFWEVITGRAYQQNFDTAMLLPHSIGHLYLLCEGAGLALCLLGFSGLVLAMVTKLPGAGTLLLSTGLFVVGPAAQRVFYPDNPDLHGYLAPVHLVLAVGIGLLVVAASKIGEQIEVRGRPQGLVLAGLVLLPCFGLAVAGPKVHVLDAGMRRKDDPLRYHDETIMQVPPGPALYLASSDHALFPALYERLVAGARPDVGIANVELVKSSWFLRMMKRALPDLWIPFLDDGGRKDNLMMRLVHENLRVGRAACGEEPIVLGVASFPTARAFCYTLVDQKTATGEALLPPQYEGEIGRRISRHVGLLRSDWEVSAGRGLEAARAAGVLERFDAAQRSALERIPPRRRPLWRTLPMMTRVFLFEEFQADLLARDLSFSAKLGAGEFPAKNARVETRLLNAWHLLLAKDSRGGDALADLPDEAKLATARMLIEHGHADDAERLLRRLVEHNRSSEGAGLLLGALLGNRGELAEAETTYRAVLAAHPRSARVQAYLGLVLAKQGRREEARAAWQASLAIDPRQPDVSAWLAASSTAQAK